MINVVLFFILIGCFIYYHINSYAKNCKNKELQRIKDIKNVHKLLRPEPVSVSSPVSKFMPENIPRTREELDDLYNKLYGAKPQKNKTKKSSNRLEWFIDKWGGYTEPSPAEQLIITELKKYKHIRWEREVSFKNFKLPTGGYPRYDFYLHEKNTIIEYHGKNWHTSPERIANDKLKEQFCKDNYIKLIVFNRYDYYYLGDRIRDLIATL